MTGIPVNPVNVISSAFDQPHAGFVLLNEGEKFPPIEKEWQYNPYTFEEAFEHVANGGNIGVLAGDGYIGLDKDDPKAFEGIGLPNSTTWETRPGRLGLWFICNDRTPELLAKYGKKADQSQLKLYKKGKPVGEIKLERTYQVIPPSWKTLENSQRVDYKLISDVPPAEISLEWLLAELQKSGITFSQKENKTKQEKTKTQDESQPQDEPKKKAGKSKSKTRRYKSKEQKNAEATFATELIKIQNADEGYRNDQLNKSAYILGLLVGKNLLLKSEVIQALQEVAEDDEPEKIIPTIKSGLEAGIRDSKQSCSESKCNCGGRDIEDEDEPVGEDIKQIASGIIARGKAFEYIHAVWQKRVKGNSNLGKALIVSRAVQSCTNTEGVHIYAHGKHGQGKSASIKAMVNLLPQEYKIDSNVSPKVLYYMGKNLRECTTVFIDDINISSDLGDMLKKVTTMFQEGAKHDVVIDGKYMHFEMSPRIAIWTNSVDLQVDEQLRDRFLDIPINENQTLAIIGYMQKKSANPAKQAHYDRKTAICREIFSQIAEINATVVTPFAQDIKFTANQGTRGYQIFDDMVKGFAILRHSVRARNEDGWIIATIDDARDAKAIYEAVHGHSDHKYTTAELKVLKGIIKCGHRAIFSDIAKATGLPESRVREIIYGRGQGEQKRHGLQYKCKDLTIEDEFETTEELNDLNGYKKRVGRKKKICILPDDFEIQDPDIEFINLREAAKAASAA